VPDAVHKELCHPAAPPVVRGWVAGLPAWAEVSQVEAIDDATLEPLGAGERAAITLALSMHADLILIDERKGTAVALGKGFDVTGTLGVLALAARRICLTRRRKPQNPTAAAPATLAYGEVAEPAA